MLLAAMLAMALLVAAPAMAQVEGDSNIVTGCTADLNQSNEGSQFAINDADQDATASQYQYQPGGAGGDATDDESVTIDEIDVEVGNNLEEIEIDTVDIADETGGAGGDGGTGSQYQYQNQSQDQDATATGPTFDATQTQYCSNVVGDGVHWFFPF